MDPCYTIQEIGVLKGKGIVATKLIYENSVIFEDEPLVCCQFSWNCAYGYKACDHCMRALESTEENVRRLTNCNDIVLPFPECCPTNKSDHVGCPSCGVQYCSNKCQQISWHQYHRILCHDSDPFHPLNELEEIWKNIHYPPENSSIMLLARIVALIEQAEDKHMLLNIFNEFCHSAASDGDNAAAQLMGSYTENIELLRSKFDSAVPHTVATQKWFTLEGFSSLLALVGANGQGVGTSPFSRWVSNVSNLQLPPDQKSYIDNLITSIYDKMDKHVGVFLDNEGSALYGKQRYVNHSCEPNAKITFPYDNSTVHLVAVKNISPGEEICISYLDECIQERRSRHTRQRLLKEHYHFVCACPRCISQMGDPDETSSDEEDDDDSDRGCLNV